MNMVEKTKERKTLFEGKILKLRLDTVILPNDKEATREFVEHPGAVGVIAVDEKDRICMVRQYRYPIGRELLEIPAGKLSPGEDPLECARRELLEETGFTAAGWEKIYTYFTTPGFSDEIMHLYLASDLTGGRARPDEDEFLELVMIPRQEVRERLQKGEFLDSKTIIGLLHLFT